MRGPMRRAPALLLFASCTAMASAQTAPPPARQNFENVEVKVLPVQGNIYMLAAAGGNITVQIGDDGITVVDTAFGPLIPKILNQMRGLSKGHIRYIINTHVHGDHLGGNEVLAKAIPTSNAEPLDIIAHANVLNRLAAGRNLVNGEPISFGLPIDEYDQSFKRLRYNGEAVVIYHEPKAHTDGDSIVLFRGSDVISTGDIFTPDSYPFIDIANGGSIRGEIAALNHLLELAVPGDHQEGGTYLIPGHGRICDDADLVEYRDMVVIITDRVQDAVKKGWSLNQVKAAKLTEDYDTQYGIQPGAGERFVESVYKSLGEK
jgi:glyoxylase-like metal-dependent hydrolase (beta-lactamase superfamily II)